MVENIYRRLEYGQDPLLAALEGSHEIGFAVIATTLVLIAVFVPLSFIEGDIGRLFREFGITLAAAVLFSSLVALTLTPMLSSKMLRRRSLSPGLPLLVEKLFENLQRFYRRLLGKALKASWASVAAVVALTWDFYRLLRRRHGLGFAVAAVPLHLLYSLYSAVAFALGLLRAALAPTRAGARGAPPP